MNISFKGKRALVTGVGKGIGREIIKALSKGGAETYGLSRTQETLATLKEECPDIHTICVDLADCEKTKSALEGLPVMDMLVNNAGVTYVTPFLDVDLTKLDWVFSINVRGAICVSQVVVKKMIERGSGGTVVNISSVASSLALENHTAYCSSKGALDQVTSCMALELGPHKIRVNSVNPTVVWTEMAETAWSDPAKSKKVLDRIPMHKFVDVEDVVNTVMFLLSDKSGMINGAFLPVDGGYSAC